MGALSNPAQDETMSGDEREFTSKALHTYQEIVREGERVFVGFCQERGVPEDVCIRIMIQIALHRAGTNAAHALAEHSADDLLVAMEGAHLASRIKAVIEKQMPLSRETVQRIGPTP